MTRSDRSLENYARCWSRFRTRLMTSAGPVNQRLNLDPHPLIVFLIFRTIFELGNCFRIKNVKVS